MTEQPGTGSSTEFDGQEVQSFVLRLRTDQQGQGGERGAAAEAGSRMRIGIRAEHVNDDAVSFHTSIEAALIWIRSRMSAVIAGPAPGDPR